MNTQNLDYLKNGLKYTGFDTVLNGDLVKKIAEGKPEFQLDIKADYGQNQMEYKLHFRKSDQNEMYFYNKYDATLKSSSENQKELTQTFYINKNRGITAKEAFNLLSGRAVHKTLVNKQDQPYDAWLQLDLNWKDRSNNFKLKQFNEGYGYDLEKSVNKYPIRELNESQIKQRLLESLRKGNLPKVTIERNGNEEQMFIQADPQYKAIKLFDNNMGPLHREAIEKLQINREPKTSVDNTLQMNAAVSKVASKKKELTAKVDPPSTVTKKRTRQKKGMSI